MLFFLLSLFSKQTGLHLPILFLLVSVIKRKELLIHSIDLKKFFIISFVILVLISLVNFLVYQNDLNIASIVWKKPFSIIGNLLHIIIPFHSQGIYNFFLINKILAIIFLGVLVLSIIVIFFIIKNKKVLSCILFGAIFFIIVMYPRLLAVAEPRINGILIFWFLVAIAFLLHKFKSHFNIIICFLFLVYYSTTFVIRLGEINHKIGKYNRTVDEFIYSVKDSPRKDFVIVGENNFTLNYQAYFHEHGKFGSYDGVINSPFFYDVSLVYFDKSVFEKPLISVTTNKDRIRIESLNDLVFLSVNPRTETRAIILQNLIRNYKSREFRQIEFSFDKVFQISDYNLIFFDGVKWNSLEIK
jgi:hypothetical protein